jgi:hypothetical protein
MSDSPELLAGDMPARHGSGLCCVDLRGSRQDGERTDAFLTDQRWGTAKYSCAPSGTAFHGVSYDVYANVLPLEVQGVRIEVHAMGLLPTWLPETVRTLQEAACLPQDWNSYGAARVHPLAAVHALTLLTQVMSDRTPPPEVGPTAEGGIQLEWHTREIDCEVAVGADGRIEACCEDLVAGSEWEEEVTQNPARLRRELRKIGGM